MKAFFGIFITILFCSSVNGQQVYQSRILTLKLPSSAVKISLSEKTPDIGTEQYKVAAAKLAKKKNYYNINGMILGFWDQSITGISTQPLEQKKEELIGMNRRRNATNVSGVIKTSNHIQFIILRYDQNDFSFYKFISENHNNQNILGFIQFRPADKNRATDLLTQVLNSIEFKN
ncbi:hypothetical protein [Pedobacter sp. L105]|uniref:hypothetical protein n=1 Tax=Pedobacter sp. L105 TaxID=1641871 RepID=UPI00131A6816|nr:hypothetical protein [Pedobacter sp. L105]